MTNLPSFITLAQTSDQLLSGTAPTAGGAPVTGTPGTASPAAQQGPMGGMGFLLPMLVVVAFFMVFTTMASRKEKKKREALLGAVKKNDKVVTLGGIIGTVAEVRENEIVLRVDDSGTTKIKFQRSAIQAVISSESAEATSLAANVELKTKSPERSAV